MTQNLFLDLRTSSNLQHMYEIREITWNIQPNFVHISMTALISPGSTMSVRIISSDIKELSDFHDKLLFSSNMNISTALIVVLNSPDLPSPNGGVEIDLKTIPQISIISPIYMLSL
jgi:hypothetical protein